MSATLPTFKRISEQRLLRRQIQRQRQRAITGAQEEERPKAADPDGTAQTQRGRPAVVVHAERFPTLSRKSVTSSAKRSGI